MKKQKSRCPDLPELYEAPECESVQTLSSGPLCGSTSGSNEKFNEKSFWF